MYGLKIKVVCSNNRFDSRSFFDFNDLMRASVFRSNLKYIFFLSNTSYNFKKQSFLRILSDFLFRM